MIYSFTGKYDFLSNFYWSPIIDSEGEVYGSGEVYFQSHKATHSNDFQHIVSAQSSSEAKRLGRKIELRSDWEAVKYNVMLDCLRFKFPRGSGIAGKLLSTGDEILLEGNNWNDKIWGAVRANDQWVGRNWLGVLLMARRAVLKDYAN